MVHVESDAERINRIEQNQTQRHGEQNEKGSLFVSAQICRGHAGYFYAEASAAAAGDLRFRIADGFYRRYFGGDSAGLEVLMRTVISAKSVLPMKIRGFAEVS